MYVDDDHKGIQVPINHDVKVVLKWRDRNGVKVSKKPVTFSTSRGTISSTSSSGHQTFNVRSKTAGVATITARAGKPSQLSTNTRLYFVATNPADMVLKAEPAKITPKGSTTITATLRDADNNPVAFKDIKFSVKGTTGGSLFPAVAETDSAGQASTTFTAGTASNGPVTVYATVVSEPAIQKRTDITIAGEPLFITLGTGNKLHDTGSATLYYKPFTVIVTNAAGNPAPNANVSLQVKSLLYRTGTKKHADITGDGTPDPTGDWTPYGTATCYAEDDNQNGILDQGEDYNGNKSLDPGNVASVPATVDLNNQGLATFDIVYPQAYSGWVRIKLIASASGISGSESTATSELWLPAAASDVDYKIPSPPGKTSPFGKVYDGCKKK